MKYGIFIMPLHYFCLLTIVNFISPNYARLSVSSLAVWLPWAYFLSISFSSWTFFLPNYAKYALGPMSECSCWTCIHYFVQLNLNYICQVNDIHLVWIMHSFHTSRLSHDPLIWFTLPGMRKESSMAICGLIYGRRWPPILISDIQD